MIKFFARGRCAQAMADNPVTTGSVGISVQFFFSPDWDSLQKIAVFRAGDTAVDVALTGDAATVPAEVLTTAGLPLMIGVYGAASDGTVVIPTVWAKAATIKAGTAPSGVDPSEPTPSWVAQVQQIAAEALETAEAVQTAAERGDFDGADGVSPTVTITTIEGGHRVTITDAAHPAGQSFDVMDGTGGSGELLVVDYDAATPGTVPDVTEIADGFDAGKAVIACASDLDGGGHVLPLTSLERSGGSVTALRFAAGGWTLSAGQVLGAWIWALTDDDTAEDLVLTFTAAWDAGADAYVVTTTATLAEIDAALADGQRIDARLTVDNDLIMRQGSVYAERTSSQLVLAAFNFLDGDICYQLEGDTGGWLLNETHLGGGGGAVDSVNGQTGAVVLTAADVGAGTYSKPSGGIPASDLASGVIPTVPTKTSDLTNDSGFVNAAGAAAAAPVQSVNGQTGAVTIAAGLSQEAKSALMDCFANVAWADANGQTYYNALAIALGLRVLTSISAVYTQSGTVYDTDTLDSLKDDLVVTANYSDSSTQTVPAADYTLSGTLTAGTSTITVSYGGKTATFGVTVTHRELLFVGASYGAGTSGGTVTFNQDGSVRLASTGQTNWGLCFSPYGSASAFKTWGDLKGHTVRLVYKITWAGTTATTRLSTAAHICSDLSKYDMTRLRYSTFIDTNTNPSFLDDKEGYVDLLIPSDASGWDGGTASVADSNYFCYRTYLISNTAGADVTVDYKFYDMGVLS